MILGIDFGTTNSCISEFTLNGKINVLINSSGNQTTPSCIYFDPETDEILIGEVAMINRDSINNFKRLVGIEYSQFICNVELSYFFQTNNKNILIVKDPNSEMCAVKLIYNKQETIYSINHLIKIYLTYLLKDILKNKNENVRAVITVPAYFNNIQRNIVNDCFTEIGCDVIRIINEPTAAALSYTQESVKEEYVLVVDCGGGTTDISLLTIDHQERIYEVVNTAGDNFLGGEDITKTLIEYFTSKMCVLDKSKIYTYIKREVERIKCELSYKQTSTFLYENSENPICIELSRTRFLDLNSSFFKKIESLIKQTIIGYKNKINKIVFVGGSTRIPYFQNICKKLINDNVEIYNELDPDKTVSIGACIQCVNLTSKDDNELDITLVDVLSSSLGVEAEGGFMIPIISKNTPFPVSKTKMFTNSDDYISFMDISIYQGERRFVKDNVLIGKITLNNLDNTLQRGEMRITIKFEVDVNGIINIFVLDDKTKSNEKLNISNKHLVVEFDNGNTEDNEDNVFKDSAKTFIILEKLRLEKLIKSANKLDIQKISYNNYRNNLTYKKLKILLVCGNNFLDYITNCIKIQKYSDLNNKIKMFYDIFKNEWHNLVINLEIEKC